MVPNFDFVFRSSQRDRFRSGDLVREWRDRYPRIFDEHDERVLKTEYQRRFNFYEWLAAVLIFESTGYLSLVTKYTAKSHPSKHDALRNSLPQDLAEWVFRNESGQPDLFVYSAPTKDWFFCEVKGPGDRLRKNQEKWRADFQSLLGERKSDLQIRHRVFRLSEIDVRRA